ncbi:Uncharacterised protein [Serratia grimesii]|nr:Uncharacterised protein [Serratia grimesii]
MSCEHHSSILQVDFPPIAAERAAMGGDDFMLRHNIH